jgi:hypothetical protein
MQIKNTLILLLCMGAFLYSNAQITLDESNTFLSSSYTDARQVDLTSTAIPIEGANQIYDFSSLSPSQTSTTEYLPTTRVGFTDYTNYNLEVRPFAGDNTFVENYGDSTTDGLARVATHRVAQDVNLVALTGVPTDVFSFPGNSSIFEEPRYFLKYPMAYGNSWENNYTVESDFFVTASPFGLDNVPGSLHEQHQETREVAGWGQLTIPTEDGTSIPYDVLMSKVTIIRVDSVFLGGAPAPNSLVSAFGLTQGAIDTSNYYVFYTEGNGRPLLTVIMSNDWLTVERSRYRSTDVVTQNPRPTNVNVETTSSSALFSWDAMPDADSYQVKYRLRGTTAWSTEGTSSTSRNVIGLTSKKYYQYKVRALYGAEWSNFTETELLFTSTCDVPTGVAATTLNNTRMWISWDANPNEIRAKVRYKEVGTSTWNIVNSTPGNNYVNISNLTPDAIYEYRVRSNCDGTDWSSYTEIYAHDLSDIIMREGNSLEFTKVYPNPTRDVLNVEFETSQAEDINITISNHLGQTVHALNRGYDEGFQIESIDMNSLANGYYFVTIRSGNRMETQKFLKID